MSGGYVHTAGRLHKLLGRENILKTPDQIYALNSSAARDTKAVENETENCAHVLCKQGLILKMAVS